MVRIGTCGYSRYQPQGGWKSRYKDKLQAFADAFPAVELNRTFYKLPMVKTAKKWREEVPEEFAFTVKAWQAITHPTSGVTWRKRKEKLTPEQEREFGYLNPHAVVFDAWDETAAVAETLRAPVVLLQTPSGFGPNDRNLGNLRAFLREIDRHGMEIAWEPRGEWNNHLDSIGELCEELRVIHVVDLLRREPQSTGETAYVRLHGLNERETDNDYDYSEEELRELARRLEELEQRYETVYCMFNNFEMYPNAQRLMELI